MDHRDYFEEAYDISERAGREAGGFTERFFRIAGLGLRLQFAGPALIPHLTRALEHATCLPEPSSAPTLTVRVWESESTGASLPLPPLKPDELYARQGEVRCHDNGYIRGSLNQVSQVLSLVDLERGLGFYFVPRADLVTSEYTGSPLRVMFHWWFRHHGLHCVHGGAVGLESGGVLMAGKGGMGKSTTALTCLFSDLLFAGDDYCVLAAEPEPYVHSLYSSAKVDGGHLENFPELVPLVSNTDDLDRVKAVLFLNRRFRHRLTPGFPLRAILLPRVAGGRHTRLTAASSMEALKAVALSSIFQSLEGGEQMLRAASELVRRLPCYHLELGTRLEDIPAVIFALLAGD